MTNDTEQARLDVGDTRKTIAIKDEKRVTTGDLAALAMCAHRYDPNDVMGWYTHDFGDVVRQWITSNVGSVIARLSPHCEDTRGDLPPLHPSEDLWAGDVETEPTQTKLVTDGGTVEDDSGNHYAEASSVLFDRWIGKAGDNIDEWGLQDEEMLLLAIQEELGELTQAVLEARNEDGDPNRIDEELDDLGALLLQFHERRCRRHARSGGESA